MRFSDWPSDDPFQPQLGDVISQETAQGAGDEDLVRRAYLVVGVEETRSGYRIVAERVEYKTMPEPPGVRWTFFNVPRRG